MVACGRGALSFGSVRGIRTPNDAAVRQGDSMVYERPAITQRQPVKGLLDPNISEINGN